MEKLTILTPAYNRCATLTDLYHSLRKQKNFDFKWLIIDDGSSDDTSLAIKKFKTDKFDIKYVYKENGGKHTALNLGFKMLDTDLVMIVDSDDLLDVNATSQIMSDWDKYRDKKNICGLVYARRKPDGNLISDVFREDEFEDNYNDYVINRGVRGDKAEVFRSEIIKKYQFPVYPGEKFVGEGVLWSKMARKYNMIFINKAIYICEYLDGGLTKSGRKMRINNPRGGMYHAEEYMDNIYTFKVREKNTLLYLIYARFAKVKFNKLIKGNKHKLLMIINYVPSVFLYLLWKYQCK